MILEKLLKNFAMFTGKQLLESLSNSEYSEIFKSTYFKKHLPTATSKNVLMKLRKIKKQNFSA